MQEAKALRIGNREGEGRSKGGGEGRREGGKGEREGEEEGGREGEREEGGGKEGSQRIIFLPSPRLSLLSPMLFPL